jgi:ankyrin repeat protein
MLTPQEMLETAAEIGSVPLARKAIKMGADPKWENSWALRIASRKGHLEVVKFLIPISDVKAFDSQALRLASRNGHLECVKLLIPLSDVKAFDSQALRYAACYGHTKVVEELKKHYTKTELQKLGIK